MIELPSLNLATTLGVVLFLGLIPGGFWFWFYFRRDDSKVSRKLLSMLFVGSLFATAGAAIIENIVNKFIPRDLIYCLSISCNTNDFKNVFYVALFMFIVVAPTEEILKYMTVKFIAFKSTDFTRITDGIKYNIAVALGFASLENAIYFFTAFAGEDYQRLALTFMTRFFISTLAHTLYAGIVGYYMGLAKFDRARRRQLLSRGLIIAIAAHGVFNFMLFTQVGYYAIILVVLVFLYIVKSLRDQQNRANKLTGGYTAMAQEASQKGSDATRASQSDMITPTSTAGSAPTRKIDERRINELVARYKSKQPTDPRPPQ